MNKFKEICEELGGEYTKESKSSGWFSTEEADVCNFESLDDFESFANWMNRQSKMPKGRLFEARYKDYSYLPFNIEFTRKNNEKRLSAEEELSLGDPESFTYYLEEKIPSHLKEITDEIIENIDWKDIYTETAKESLLKHIPGYLRDASDIEVGFNSDWDYHYIKGSIDYPLSPGINLKATIRDTDKALDTLLSKAEDRFYTVLDEQLELTIEKMEEKNG